MRLLSRLGAVLLCALAVLGAATPYTPVVDSKGAEALFRERKYREARTEFEALLERFRGASKDSSELYVYREAAYLYDRTADCSFTMRDWPALKRNMDGLLVVNMSERNFSQSQLAGAVDTGVGRAVAKYLMDQLDEAVRLSSLTQLKRSISLAVLDKGGEGSVATECIKLYQELVAILQKVLVVENGAYVLEVSALEKQIDAIEDIDRRLKQQVDVEALWEKYKPEGGAAAASAGQP